MEAYFAAKLRLFTEVVDGDGSAVVWADDGDWSAQVIAAARARGLKLLTVGENGDTLRLVQRTPTQLGQTLELLVEGRTHRVELPLIGAYQAANALVAAGLVLATGGTAAGTLGNLARLVPVRGRLERAVIARSGAPVYVDYAHTPDALRRRVRGAAAAYPGQAAPGFRRWRRPRYRQAARDGRGRGRARGRGDSHRRQPAQRRSGVDPRRDHGGSAGRDEIGDRRSAIADAVRSAGADESC